MADGERQRIKEHKMMCGLLRVLLTISVLFFQITSLVHGEETLRDDNRGALSSIIFKRIKREDNKLCLNSGKWDEGKQRCICTLGWVGMRCAIWRYNECYFDDGSDYRGNFSLTKTGQQCLPWTAKENNRFPIGQDGVGTHNYCRNPDNDENGPWCFVGGKKFHEICNITLCSDEYRALLLINATGQDTETSAAVKILFGPLISGICVGVVALLGFIAAAEYFRRKRNAKRKKEQEANTIQKSDIQHTDHDSIRERHVRTFGGIVTVDVDTGKQKTKTVKMKTVSKAENAIKEATGEAHHNDAFVMDLEGKITSAGSCDNLKETVNKQAAVSSESPPPPYQETEAISIEHSSDGGYEIKKAEDVETPPTAVKRPTKRKKDVKVPVEEPIDLPEPPLPPPVPVPVPRPRKSIGSSPKQSAIVEEKDGGANGRAGENRTRTKRRKRRSKMTEKVEEVTSESQTGSPEMRTNKIESEHKKRRTKRQGRKSTADNATEDSTARRKERRSRKKTNGDVQPTERRSRRKREPTKVEGREDNKETNDGEFDSQEIEAINKALKNKLKGTKIDEPSTFI